MLRSFLYFLLVYCLGSTPALGVEHSRGTAEKIVQTVQQNALYPPSVAVLEDFTKSPYITTQKIRHLLTSFDPWATWTTADERMEETTVRRALNSGAGMALVYNKAEDLVCLPYPQSPAHTAGIVEGDILKSIDGYTVLGVNLADITVLLLGKNGTQVQLGLERDGVPFHVTIVRQQTTMPHVQWTQHNGFAQVRIWYFSKETPALLAQVLQSVGHQPLILDVRGNTGGNRVAALICAAEFLAKGKTLGFSHTRKDGENAPPKATRTRNDGKFIYLDSPIIWQDPLTASAAEAFVAALVDSGGASVIGKTSFGKGMAQNIFTIDGHTLHLSTAVLMRPDGTSWDGVGIAPHHRCKTTSVHDLATITYRLLYQ